MERVGILINKLQEQLAKNAGVKNMLVTAQMLQAELMQNVQKQNGHSVSRVSVVLPFSSSLLQDQVDIPETIDTPVITHTKAPEPAAITEDEPEEELQTEPEPAAAAFVQQPEEVTVPEKVVTTSTPGLLFNPVEVPPVAHQHKNGAELNDTMPAEGNSLNEALKEDKTEVAHTLQGTPIKDLKKAISINDRHRFIHDLFRDDETMYERSIKTINSFNIFPEAEYWIQRELKLKHGWDNNNETVKIFDQLVKRRFS